MDKSSLFTPVVNGQLTGPFLRSVMKQKYLDATYKIWAISWEMFMLQTWSWCHFKAYFEVVHLILKVENVTNDPCSVFCQSGSYILFTVRVKCISNQNWVFCFK